MTELELYKYIHDEETSVEYSFDGERAIIWVYHFNIDDFVKVIGSNVIQDGGISVRLQDHFIEIEMNEICEYHDIELDNIFTKTN